MIYQSYNLNLVPDKVPLSVWVSQFDVGSRTLQFVIYDGSVMFEIPSGSTVTMRGTKPDNTGFEYPCTFSDSLVSVVIEDQMTVLSGKVPCEIRITNSGEIVGTANFNLMVEKTPLDPDVTISDTYLPLLEDAEQNAIRAEQASQQAVSVLSTAVKSVNYVLPDTNGNVNVSGALPGGGTQGQVLTKQSSAYGDVDWDDIDALPSGGTQGQALIKQSSTDGDADWEDIQALPSGGTTGQYLVKSSATEGDADWQTKEVELTQAQYDALPSTKLTDGVSYYITDGESAPSTNRFSADGISYGNGSVADALDKLNGSYSYGNQTDISAYNSSSNMFTAPTDGYVLAQVWNADTSIQLWIGSAYLRIDITYAVVKNYALFLKKGSKVWSSKSGTNGNVYFLELI